MINMTTLQLKIMTRRLKFFQKTIPELETIVKNGLQTHEDVNSFKKVRLNLAEAVHNGRIKTFKMLTPSGINAYILAKRKFYGDRVDVRLQRKFDSDQEKLIKMKKETVILIQEISELVKSEMVVDEVALETN